MTSTEDIIRRARELEREGALVELVRSGSDPDVFHPEWGAPVKSISRRAPIGDPEPVKPISRRAHLEKPDPPPPSEADKAHALARLRAYSAKTKGTEKEVPQAPLTVREKKYRAFREKIRHRHDPRLLVRSLRR